jgi:hypothetical protein
MLPTLSEDTRNGIFQSDIIILTALKAAIQDLRANPFLLQSIWASLPQDEQTARRYGELERKKAIEWFTRNDIPVVIDWRLEGTPPAKNFLSVSLLNSDEAENTLADINSTPSEDTEADWPILLGPVDMNYDATTGALTVPNVDGVIFAPDMVVLDTTGKDHLVLSADGNTVYIETNANASFRNACIKGQKPRLITGLESLSFKETYRIGCHATGNAVEMIWLHSVVVFILLRYKQELIEARGLERTVIGSSPPQRSESFGQQNMWSRFINLTGYVRQTWPKFSTERILSTSTDAGFVASGTSADTEEPETFEDQMFTVFTGGSV